MAKFLFYDDKLINILVKDEKPSGGAAVQAYGWVRGFQAAGEEVMILTNPVNGSPVKEECRDLKLLPLYDRKKGIRWIRWIYYRLPHIYKQIKKAAPDYLYQGIPTWSSYLLALICKRLNIRFVLRISNDFLVDERFFKQYSRIHRYFQWKGFEAAYAILCQNAYQYTIIKKHFPAKKVLQISNPIFKMYRGEIPSTNQRSYIAWMGIFQYQKNLRRLYEICCSMPQQAFHIAGKADPKCDLETLDFLERISNLPNVKIVGYLSRHQVLEFISKASWLLNTSHYEGFSNTFLEAMSAGTPILTSEAVNPDGIIDTHQLGIVYTSTEDLLAKYNTLTSTAYEQMRSNAYTYVMDHHEYTGISRKLLQFLSNN